MKPAIVNNAQSAEPTSPGPARPSVLVACIGNIFLGDDAFGVEVARRLAHQELPAEVRVVDFGIRGLDLVYALMEGYDLTILVDAMPRGEAPGTLFVLEPDLQGFAAPGLPPALVDAHEMNPLRVLSLAYTLGARFKRLLILGCEPATLGGAEGYMGLSEPVQQAAAQAVEVIARLIGKELAQLYDKGLNTN